MAAIIVAENVVVLVLCAAVVAKAQDTRTLLVRPLGSPVSPVSRYSLQGQYLRSKHAPGPSQSPHSYHTMEA